RVHGGALPGSRDPRPADLDAAEKASDGGKARRADHAATRLLDRRERDRAALIACVQRMVHVPLDVGRIGDVRRRPPPQLGVEANRAEARHVLGPERLEPYGGTGQGWRIVEHGPRECAVRGRSTEFAPSASSRTTNLAGNTWTRVEAGLSQAHWAWSWRRRARSCWMQTGRASTPGRTIRVRQWRRAARPRSRAQSRRTSAA